MRSRHRVGEITVAIGLDVLLDEQFACRIGCDAGGSFRCRLSMMVMMMVLVCGTLLVGQLLLMRSVRFWSGILVERIVAGFRT